MARHPRSTGWIGRALIVRALVCLGVLAVPATFPPASAAFSAVAGNDANSMSTDEVAAPSAVAVTQTCAPGIAWRGSVSATGAGSLTLSPPAGTVAGDLLVAQVANRDGHALSVPLGWNPIELRTTAPGSTATVTSALFWKWAAAGEAASTFTLGTTGVQMVGGVVAYSGVHATSPVDDSLVTTGTGSVATAPSVKTTAANAMLVHAFAKRSENLPAPAGTEPRWSLISGSGLANNLGATASDVLFAGPGTTTARSTTGSNAHEWVAHTVALRPASGGPSVTVTWPASTSAWATGYRLERSAGGTVQATGTITPISATSTVDGPLVNGTTYSYRLWAYSGTWTSPDVTATITPTC